ncbi:TPA: hypothetical protein ACH3X3_011926 [Trebouxia sp. C0006]
MAVKEHVQMAEMAKRLQQAHMDWDRAVKVVQLKSQVQLGLAEGREQSFINSIRRSIAAPRTFTFTQPIQLLVQGVAICPLITAKVLELQELLRVQEAAWQQQQQRELDRLERENTEFKQYAQRNQREHENNVSVMRQQQAEFKKQLQQAQKTLDLLQTEKAALPPMTLRSCAFCLWGGGALPKSRVDNISDVLFDMLQVWGFVQS